MRPTKKGYEGYLVNLFVVGYGLVFLVSDLQDKEGFSKQALDLPISAVLATVCNGTHKTCIVPLGED